MMKSPEGYFFFKAGQTLGPLCISAKLLHLLKCLLSAHNKIGAGYKKERCPALLEIVSTQLTLKVKYRVDLRGVRQKTTQNLLKQSMQEIIRPGYGSKDLKNI